MNNLPETVFAAVAAFLILTLWPSVSAALWKENLPEKTAADKLELGAPEILETEN
jgi:hypothetical protein